MDGQSLYDVYRTGLWGQVGVNAAAGVWALAAHRWPAVRNRALWVVTVVAQLVVTANVVMASVLLAQGDAGQARRVLEQALALAPGHPDPAGQACMSRDRRSRSIRRR